MSGQGTTSSKTRWQKIARRIRVPLGFVFAGVFLWLARPTWGLMLGSLLPVGVGVWLRGYAAGYVKKNAELTSTGPYAYTRNPLYLGSMLIAFGFAAASGRWVIVVVLMALFLAIYLPTILSEEEFLRGHFAQFDAYAEQVPRLLPRLTPARFGQGAGAFSKERYLHHREYNALMGAGRDLCGAGGAFVVPGALRSGSLKWRVEVRCAEVQIDCASPYSLKRTLLSSFFVGILLLACGVGRAQYTPIPTLQPPVPGFSFPAGQTLTFDVDWRVFTRGQRSFTWNSRGPRRR